MKRLVWVIATVLFCATISGCITAYRPASDDYPLLLSKRLPIPPGYYCSPYLADGELTTWARKGIEEGIGLYHRPAFQGGLNVYPYPDNRFIAYSLPATYKVGANFKREQIRVSENAVGLIGGWDQITGNSDTQFESIEQLALSMFDNHREHPRYAEALAVTMQVYPALREEYYQAVTGSGRFWYRPNGWPREAPWYESED